MMNYMEARIRQDELHDACKVAGARLNSFPKGAMGLTPDDVKRSSEFRMVSNKYYIAFNNVRAFNTFVNKTFAKERKEYIRASKQ